MTAQQHTWPEGARRYVKALQKALRVSRAELAHYVSIVEEHEHEWLDNECLGHQVEALGVENAELRIECERLRAQCKNPE